MPTFSVYKIVTDRFIDALKKDIVPWQKPWQSTGGDQWPINRFSGKPYRGINVMLLGITAALEGYVSNEWLSYKQATALGGQVRKGEKSSLVTFWKTSKYTKENTTTGEDETKKGFLLRYYNVFNISQCNGIEPRRAAEPITTVQPFQPIEAASGIVASWNSKPNVRHGGNIAAYMPELDYITMPKKTSFASPEAYYHTLFHELVHSTGHKTRLNRELGGNMLKDSYAKEELIAEIGASFISTSIEIDVASIVDNSKAYVRHWLKRLEEDEKLILQAAGAAQKAVDMIMGTTFEAEETASDEVVETAAA